MSAELGTAGLLTLVALGVALAVALEIALFWPALERRLASCHPARAAWAAWAAALAPVALAGLAVGLCLAPGLAGALGAGDHCLEHAGHPHLCLMHPVAGRGAAGALGLALAAGGLVLAASGAQRLRRARRLLRRLARLPRLEQVSPASRGAAPGVDALLDVDAPLAVSAGWWRPRVLVSRGLAEALDARGLAAVVAHERAHARRRDALRELAARGLSFAHLPGTRRRILAGLHAAAERACDEEAAREIGDRLSVAEALLRVERLGSRGPKATSAGAAGFGDGSVAERVRALLEPAPARPGRAASLALALGAVAAAWAGSAPLHHAVEHLLARIVGGS